MNQSLPGPEIPDWMLERYSLGELPEEEMQRVREALERDGGLHARLAALEADSAAVLAAHPPRVVGASIRARLAGDRRSVAWRPVLAFAAPLLLAVVVVGVWREREAQNLPTVAALEPDSTRVKGAGPRLLLFRRAGPHVEALSSGATARPGDVVQLAYQAAGARYGAIVSIDGRGAVTEHLPATGALAAPLRSGGPVTLGAAYRLDDAPRFEAFYLVTASRAFDLAPVRAAARAAAAQADAPPAALALPGSFAQAAFILRKDVPQ